MAMTDAERQAARRARLLAAMAERDELAARVVGLEAETSRLGAELQAAQSGRLAGRCPACGTELGCPRCYRGED